MNKIYMISQKHHNKIVKALKGRNLQLTFNQIILESEIVFETIYLGYFKNILFPTATYLFMFILCSKFTV